MIDIGLKIKELMSQNKIDAPALAKRLGKTKQAVYSMIEKEDINTSILKELSDIFEVPVTYFLTEDGTGPTVQNDEDEEPVNDTDKGVPFVDDSEMFAAGPLAGFGEAIIPSDVTDHVNVPSLSWRDGDFAVRTRGRSMIDKAHPEQNINDGAIVCLRPWRESHIQWGEIYSIATPGGFAIKRLMPSANEGCVSCVSSNEAEGYAPYDVPVADIRGIAKVTAIINLQLL